MGIGLSEKEAEVYLSSMSLGPSTISEISKASGIKRTTVYSIFEDLAKRGLMREEVRGWKKLYAAEGPEKLESIIDQMKTGIRQNMPEFSALYNLHSSGAFIKYYEGLENVKNVYNDLLKDLKIHDDYLIIGDLDRWFEQDRDFFEDFIWRRAKLNIKIRMLLPESEKSREHKKIGKNIGAEIRILPADYKLTTNMVIVPGKVIINQLVPPIMVTVIQNENIVQMNRELFEIIWKSILEKGDHLLFDAQVAEAKRGRGFKTAKEALRDL